MDTIDLIAEIETALEQLSFKVATLKSQINGQQMLEDANATFLYKREAEKLAMQGLGTCESCGKPFIFGPGTGGRNTRRYCGNTCLKRAHRALSKPAPPSARRD